MKEYPLNKNYIIYEDGRIYSKHYKRFLTPKNNWDGYYRIQIYENNKSKFISWHRIIAQTFIPNPENKPFVNHINGNKKDNRVENLEWCTQKENIKHAFLMGLSKPHPNETMSKKINCYDINHNLIKTYNSITDVYKDLGVARPTVATHAKNHTLYNKKYYFDFHKETSND